MEKIIFLILAFATANVLSDKKLEPIYEKGNNVKLFKFGQSLTLQCKPKVDGLKIYWLKEEEGKMKNISDITSLKGHYRTIDSEGKFIIEKTRENDAGKYACEIFGNPVEEHSFDVWAQLNLKVPSDTQLKEGDRLALVCIFKGTKPEIKWRFKPEISEEEKNSINRSADDSDGSSAEREEKYADVDTGDQSRYKVISNDDNSTLVIESVAMTDRGWFKCIGTNDAMDDATVEVEGFVRVKDRMAALWPAIGIAAQIVVLALIIIISENRRNKNEVDESDTDEAPEKKEDANFIRRRH